MQEKIKRIDVVCNKGSRIRIADYTTEKDFDKKYKILVINDSQEVLYATNISQIETNFEITYNDYEGHIRRLEEKCRAYEDIIEKFLSRLDIDYKKEEIEK